MTTTRKKRILRKFKLSEISPVDRPAQGPALAVLMKRAEETGEDLVKITFQEALAQMKLEEEAREALDDLWMLNDALRQSVRGIVEDPNKYPDPVSAVKQSLADFSSAVISMIGSEMDEEMDDEDEAFKQEPYKTEGGAKYPAGDFAYTPDRAKPSTWKLRLTSTPGGDPDRRIVGAAVAALGPGFRGNKVEIPADALSAVKARVRNAWKKANPDADNNALPEVLKHLEEDKDMSDHKDQNTPSVEEMQKNLDQANARAERAEKIAELTDVQKSHFNSLDDAGKDEFLKKDAGARQQDIEKAAANDAVIYTSADGEEFRKSDDPRLVRMAKQADEDRKARQEEMAKREKIELTKRAEDELSHLPGDVDTKVALLKAVNGVKDEETRTKIDQLLKAQNTAMGGAFETGGTTAAPAINKADAEAKLATLAKKHAADNNVPYETAYTAVLSTDEGQALYEQTQ